MRTTIALVVALVLGGCVAPPGVYDFQKTWDVSSDYDRAWAAIIEVYAESGFAVHTLEKDSGIIASDWIADNSPGICDCGKPGLDTVGRREARFNILLARNDLGAPRLTINTNYREYRRSLDGPWFTVPCNSTGRLEAVIRERIETKLK